jgi:branched-chain amino acid transport system permease protein
LYFALAAYCTAGLTVFFAWPASVAITAAIAASTVAAALIGYIVVRSSGIFFLMTTLAFGQMGWTYFSLSPRFGAIEGLSGVAQIDLSPIGLSLSNPGDFAIVSIAICAAAYLALATVVDSPFGHALLAIQQNENRARALGIPTLRYKVVAFTIGGAVAGLAGALAAERTQFVSPELAAWSLSGDVLVMVIVGGVGTLIGPIIGAVIWVIFRHGLSEITPYWLMWVGIFFIAVMLFARGGVFGAIEILWQKRRA